MCENKLFIPLAGGANGKSVTQKFTPAPPLHFPEWKDSTPEYKTLILASIESFFTVPIDMTPEVNHALYVNRAVRDGWKGGTEFNAAAKINPRIRPFKDLSRENKEICDIILSTYRRYKNVFVPDYINSCTADSQTIVINGFVNEQHNYFGKEK